MESILQPLSGYGAPTKNTVGSIGDIYTDLITETKYKCITVFSYTGYNTLTVEYVWKKIIKEQNNSGSCDNETSRIVGTIENLQMAKVTGLTSTMETKVLDYDYIIQTESTGGNDASVSINGTNYLYSDVKSNPVTIDGSLELSYTDTSWTLKALTDLQNLLSDISYSQGDTIGIWSYQNTINIYLNKTVIGG